MPEELRKTGVDVLGDAPWGAHFCQFYEIAEDLIEVLVPYFKAGLESNEFCMWVCSEPLAAKDAEEALRAAVPDLDAYLEKGKIEIVAHDEWYVQDGAFDSQRVLDGWVEKLNAALAAGYDGLRLTGNTHWLEGDDWADFAAYEEQVNSVIGRYRILAICSYPLGKCGAAEIVDVVSNHQSALIRRQGKWQRCENPDRRRAEESLRLHDEIAANMSEGVYLVRASDGVIAYANPTFEEMFGYEPGEMVGQHVSIVNAPTENSPEETAREIMAFIAANGYWRGEVNNIKKDGTPFWCRASVSVLDHPEYGNVLVAVHTDITDRKRAEDAQRLHGEIAANMPGGVHLVRAADGVIVYTNPKFEEIFGYGPGELIGKHISIVNAPTDKSPRQTAMEIMDAMARNGSWQGEILNIRKDGTPFWCYASVSMFDHPEHGTVFVAVHTDITDRRRADDALQASEARYRHLFDNMPSGVAHCRVILDRDGKPVDFVFLAVNDAFETLTGLTRDAVIGRKVTEVIPGIREAHPELFDIYGQAALAGTEKTFEIDVRPLEDICLSITAYSSARGEFVAVFESLTERRRAEKEISDLALFPSEDPYPVLRIAADGAVLYANSAGSDLLRAQNSQVAGQAPPKWRDCVSTAVDTGSVARRQVQLDEKVYTLHFVPVPDVGYVNVYGTDITERIQVEEQLRQAQKMEAFGQLAGGVAHDFRNQLAVIKGYSEMLLRGSLVTEEGREDVDEILKAANRSAKFTGQLLAFSRKELLRPEVMSLCDLIENMIEMLKKMIGEDIELSVLPGAHGLVAHLDPGIFHQAILNLAANSRDAMPDGGSLTIGIEACEVDAAAVARYPDVHPGRYVVVSVADTGAGMDEETRARVFEPFFTTKEVDEGTGLGLSMVHGFVHQSGGFVEVDSEPGRGTTFRLHFPAVGSVVQSPPPGPEREEIAGGTETILVVEDEESLRRLVAASLREWGYTVLEAKDAREAAQHAESEGALDMLVTDVVMPGASGVELAKHFRRLRPEAAVLYVSGYGMEDLSRRGIKHSQMHVLTKPFSHDDLLAAVRLALDAKKRAPTSA